MGRKPKLVSVGFPLDTLGLNIDKYYKRMTAQADEMYRKSRWQVEPGGPNESPMLLGLAKAANSTSKQVRSLYYKRWKDHVQGMFDAMAESMKMTPIQYDEATEIQMSNVLSMVADAETLVRRARLAREVYGRSLEVAYMYELFVAEIDPEAVNPNKKTKTKGTTK